MWLLININIVTFSLKVNRRCYFAGFFRHKFDMFCRKTLIAKKKSFIAKKMRL
jgi:hypothetical protein